MDAPPPTTSAAAEPSPPAKLRLMCSYGGHILPRPHDRALTYVGGDTRIVSVDRRSTTLTSLVAHLSRTLRRNSAAFALRYQLPNEDLDSLISLATQEDLDNMLEEHDRIARSPPNSSGGRIRLFVFPGQNSAADQQNLLETASNKSDDWFFNRINGKPTTPVSDRGFSESSSVNCLLGLEEDDFAKVEISNNVKDEANRKVDCKITTTTANNNANYNSNHDACESPIKVETASSSFGSTSSSPSVGLVDLPPIKVRVQDTNQKVALGIAEEQLRQMNLEGNFGNLTPPPPPPQLNDASAVQQRVLQHPQNPQQQFHMVGGVVGGGGIFDSPSPDSVSSDGSFTNPPSRPRHAVHQDQNSPGIHIQEQPAFVIPPPHYDHPHQSQSFLQANTKHIHSGAAPIPSYYPLYPPQQPQQQQPLVDHSNNYPFYIVSTRPPPHNLPCVQQQASYGEVTKQAASNVTPPPPRMMGFTQSRNSIAPSVGVAPQMVQFGQNHGQYVAYGQNHHHHNPSRSMAPLANPVYAYHEFADSPNAGIYYTPPQVAEQFQLRSPEALAQISVDRVSHHQA